MNAKEQTIATYNASAIAKAAEFNSFGARVADIERAFSFITKENPRVLEIGCGNGRDAAEILKYAPNYLGIDISEGMINLAKQTAPTGSFEIHDVDNYQFPADLDTIFSFASLLHSDRFALAGILERAHRALNLGGIFYVSLKFDEYHEEVRTDQFGTRIFFFYTPELFKELAGEGFAVLWEDVQQRKEKWFTLVLRKK